MRSYQREAHLFVLPNRSRIHRPCLLFPAAFSPNLNPRRGFCGVWENLTDEIAAEQNSFARSVTVVIVAKRDLSAVPALSARCDDDVRSHSEKSPDPPNITEFARFCVHFSIANSRTDRRELFKRDLWGLHMRSYQICCFFLRILLLLLFPSYLFLLRIFILLLLKSSAARLGMGHLKRSR